MKIADALKVLAIGVVACVLFVALLHQHSPSFEGEAQLRPERDEARALVARLRRVVDEIKVVQAEREQLSEASVSKSDESAQHDCCVLAQKHKVVIDVGWGTLPTALQTWWNEHDCNTLAAPPKCVEGRKPNDGKSISAQIRRLQQLLERSHAREDRLEAENRALSEQIGEATGKIRARVTDTGISGSRGIVMSCPSGRQGMHNPGSWKPADPFTGVSAVADQLVSLNSTLELVFVHFPGDGSEARCLELQKRLAGRLKMTCHAASGNLPQGYGVAKVEAVLQAPLTEVIWLDCDAFPLKDLTPLLLDESYRNTGAIFWGDIEGHFDANKLRNMFKQQKVDPKLFPLDSWRTRMGFDSGVLVINKAKCSAVMNRLQEMTRSFQQQWAQYTHGDKDLWHIAWMLHNQNFTYVPYVGALGAFCESDHKFCMTAQAKFDLEGRTVVTHQLWRDGILPKPNFHGHEWPALTPELGGQVRYNPPDLTIRYDLRKKVQFRYARVGQKYPEELRSTFKPATDWQHITNDPSFSADNMYVLSRKHPFHNLSTFTGVCQILQVRDTK
eukprot:m.28532 g.28532  ORF g.28532 m.28532 type:complete len:558 (-) comp6562_c0_seq2:98-1771(-)